MREERRSCPVAARGIHSAMMNQIKEDISECDSAYPQSVIAWIYSLLI